MPLHKAKVVGETYQGERVYTTGYSGNRKGLNAYLHNNRSRHEKRDAVLFANYLERLTDENILDGKGKTAFTCAEPEAIIEALLMGATFDSIYVYHIQCNKEQRKPCKAFCSKYLEPTNDKGYYKIDTDEIFRQ